MHSQGCLDNVIIDYVALRSICEPCPHVTHSITMTSLVKIVNIILQVMDMKVLFKVSTHKGGNGWIIARGSFDSAIQRQH